MRILAIDPSLGKIGIAVIAEGRYERSYTFSTDPDQDLATRLKLIGDHFRGITDPYDIVVIEQPDVFARRGTFAFKNLASIMLLMTALGTIVASLNDRYKVFLFLVSEWKGHENKRTTQEDALREAGQKLNTHESDATMMGLAYIKRGPLVMQTREAVKTGEIKLRSGPGKNFLRRRYFRR